MTLDEALSLSNERTFNRAEVFASGPAAVLTRVVPQMGALWEEEVVSYDLAEARAIIAGSEAAIRAGLKSRRPRTRSCADALVQKLAQFMAWKAEREAHFAEAA